MNDFSNSAVSDAMSEAAPLTAAAMRPGAPIDKKPGAASAAAGMTRRYFLGGAAAAAAYAAGVAFARPAWAGKEPAAGSGQNAASDAKGVEGTSASASSASNESAFMEATPGIADAYVKPEVAPLEELAQAAKRVLVVVDYQVDFVDGGVFGRVEPAVAIEDALCASIQEYLDAGDIVIYTMDTHPQDIYAQTREGQFNVPHCIPGTEGWELYGKVRDLLNPDVAIQVKKGTYGSPDLPFIIRAIRDGGTPIKSIEIAGVSTTCRVLHNAILLYTYFPETMLIMDRNTTASYEDDLTVEQLKELEGWGFVIKW